jgi:hypothetical protein
MNNLGIGLLLGSQRAVSVNVHGRFHVAMPHQLVLHANRSARLTGYKEPI